jgi:hypothetical protein
VLDLAHVEEVFERTLDLERGRMGRTGVEGGDVDGSLSVGDEFEEMLGKKTTVECVRAMSEEVEGL